MKDTLKRRKDMIWGALVADAASLGLHWIYAQPRIHRIAPEKPEFLEPDPTNYEGVPAYFAHGQRHAGDLSMYGEGMLVLLRSLRETGDFDWQRYAQQFSSHFGFGGEYVGYIDTPTRGTLINLIRQDEDHREEAMSVPFDGDEDEKHAVAMKVLGQVKILRGQALRDKVRETIRQTKGTDAQQKLATAMLDRLESSREYPGTDDLQLPALTRLPILAAVYPDHADLDTMVDEAVRVTHNNETALAWSHFVMKVLRWSLSGDAAPEQLREAIQQAMVGAPDGVTKSVQDALDRVNQDPKTTAMKLGPACELKSGVPVALHTLLNADGYIDAVRKNIYNCGDSCGRAMVLGALAGALYGVPDEWKAQVNRKKELEAHIDSLCS
jgi:ADP-ribosylglycohydrolase